MFEKEIKKYQTLNALAERGGTVIFGGSGDCEIPLCELKQAFALNTKIYNRSFDGLSAENAVALYDTCVAVLQPETVLLHIGESDLKMVSEEPAAFAAQYRELIAEIRAADKHCRIVVVSQKNHTHDACIAKLNKQLGCIAESERCEFADISDKKVWNPKETKEVISFVYDTGFVRPLAHKRPIYDLVKILFCCE